MPRIELERPEEIDDSTQTSAERFDRIAFAERAIALVSPNGPIRIAVCEGSRGVRAFGGRQWGGAPGERWAILVVPGNASRRAIATAVFELGAGDPQPWALDVLMDRRP